MAGGKGRKDESFPRETLAERVAATRARQNGQEQPPVRTGHTTADFHRQQPAAPPSWTALPTNPAVPTTPPPVIKHAWYRGPLGRQPALLLRWRSTGEGQFDGLVCTVMPDGDGYALVEFWVDAGLLSPA